MFRQILAVAFGVALSIPGLAAQSQKPADGQNETFDVRSSIGDAHLGADADARKAGVPLYPGARPRRDKENSDAVNIGVLTEAFGFKLVVANYESDDDPGKVIDFYRDKLKKYGKVLECHTSGHGGDVHVNASDHDSSDSKESDSKELKCDDDNQGKTTELKVGTEDDQHVVAIEPAEKGAGAKFALVYVHTRGRQGDI